MTKFSFQLSALVLSGLLSSSAWAQSYRILLSNDDGIESPLLAALHQELSSLPNVEVVVSAPNENQSGASHSSTGGPMTVEKLFRNGELFGYAVHGRPADAVRFGLLGLGAEDPFDLVISGINLGANVGDVSHLSGTVGSAMEGIYQGVPAIAISQDVQGVDTEASAKFAAQLVQRYQRDGAPVGTLVSINIPRGELKGVAVRPMGDSYLHYVGYDLLEEENNRSVYQRLREIEQSTDSSTDTYAYQHGYITITPIKLDWTDRALIGEIQSWDLQLIE